ncbi:wax ester/triacylglycerol synthase family O-acyltransferase [Iamia majanohamensis]|uniref:diacylglycerol O-acyltransferase n=1 Tax=Iamia majanohamensis TaxID=467976 RepID=A0AAE9Y3I7_9ACTN|nr:wax ester/triacylglycerol synthase domain-containing protein [Iamia majanohamensis]WCO65825.1 wax ester/triacylglycerol synthase family O-acyltransferase [Iamia majanohamensis]
MTEGDELVYDSRMSDSDALMWTIEKDAMLRSTITAVAVLDRAPDHDRLRTLLDRGTRIVPRLRQRVRANPLSIAPPRWEVDPSFDLDYHVRFARATGDGTLRDVLDMVQPIAMAGFDRARPLWEATLVEGMEDGRAALVMKVHHAITDGVGSVKLALIMFELERDPDGHADLPPPPEAEVMSQVVRWVDALAHEQRRALGIARRSGATVGGATARTAGQVVTDPAATASRAAETVASVARLAAPATAPLSPLMTGRSLSVRFDHLSVPLEAAKTAARAAGATLNDAFVAATAGGLTRYHLEMGVPADELRMSMPINVRTAETEDHAGNQFVPARFAIPLGEADPVRRMQTLHQLILEQRGEPALGFVEPMAAVLRRLPTSVSTSLFGSMLKGVDLVTSNVPGAPIPIYTAGGRVEHLIAYGPLTGAALNLTLLSYLDELHIGVNVDPAAVTEPERLVAALRDAWDEVLAVGAPRRSPGRPRRAAPRR